MRINNIKQLIILLMLLTANTAFAADAETIKIGYLDLENDYRYVEKQMNARFPGKPWGRPQVATEIALREVRFTAASMGVEFKLLHERAENDADLKPAVERLISNRVKFILLDLPDDSVASVSNYARASEVLLFNLSANSDTLRQKQCATNLLHMVASESMLTDALSQYLKFKKWNNVLLLVGPNAEDLDSLRAFEHSAKKFGIQTVDVKHFIPGLDPRKRDKNNISLLTSGSSYDLVWVIDSTGEFARDIPYQIQKPQIVVGAAGLVATGWHWAWERHGAPQLNRRFEKKAKRQMTDYDWSAWMSIKTIAEAVLRTRSTDFAQLSSFIKGTEIVLDGFKGARLSFRSWNNQLRQPVFVTTDNWVVARTPLEGFLHQVNNLDTLGYDKRESQCVFR
jgi:ABC transporter substrate binding protein (PQQ-dependent alcohol dehydrogenase system)